MAMTRNTELVLNNMVGYLMYMSRLVAVENRESLEVSKSDLYLTTVLRKQLLWFSNRLGYSLYHLNREV